MEMQSYILYELAEGL